MIGKVYEVVSDNFNIQRLFDSIMSLITLQLIDYIEQIGPNICSWIGTLNTVGVL